MRLRSAALLLLALLMLTSVCHARKFEISPRMVMMPGEIR